VEVQSVSISLTQDEEEEETKKLSTLFNFMAGKKSKSRQELRQQPHQPQSLQLHQQQQYSPSKEAESLQEDKLLSIQHESMKLDFNPPPRNTVNHIFNQASSQCKSQSFPDVLSNHSSNKNPNVSHVNLHKPLLSRNHRQVLSIHCNSTKSSSSSSSGVSSASNTITAGGSLDFNTTPPCRNTCVSKSSLGALKSGTSSSSSPPDVPYGTVIDEVTEEENIYAEISDAFTLKLSLNPMHHQMGGLNLHRLNCHQNGSNMSSLLKGSGGSDGAFSGTFSGTFSSSNPSSREEDIYDAVF
jgi:hypothetical protein